MSEPTERDYQRYVGDSFKEFNRILREHEQRIVEGIIRESEFEKRIAELEHNMIFLSELGIEKHIADHNRDNHQREMALDFRNSAGLSRAGIEY